MKKYLLLSLLVSTSVLAMNFEEKNKDALEKAKKTLQKNVVLDVSSLENEPDFLIASDKRRDAVMITGYTLVCGGLWAGLSYSIKEYIRAKRSTDRDMVILASIAMLGMFSCAIGWTSCLCRNKKMVLGYIIPAIVTGAIIMPVMLLS